MKGTITFKYDPVTNIVFVEDNWEIVSKQDADEFFEEYRKFFVKLGKKVYLVAHIDNLRVHAGIADYYGKVSRETIGRYLIDFVRWGTNDRARMTVRTTSSKVGISANIYSTRLEAIKAIEEMKQKGQKKV